MDLKDLFVLCVHAGVTVRCIRGGGSPAEAAATAMKVVSAAGKLHPEALYGSQLGRDPATLAVAFLRYELDAEEAPDFVVWQPPVKLAEPAPSSDAP